MVSLNSRRGCWWLRQSSSASPVPRKLGSIPRKIPFRPRAPVIGIGAGEARATDFSAGLRRCSAQSLRVDLLNLSMQSRNPVCAKRQFVGDGLLFDKRLLKVVTTDKLRFEHNQEYD